MCVVNGNSYITAEMPFLSEYAKNEKEYQVIKVT